MLTAGAAHVWRVELSCVEDRVTALLDASERARAAQIVDRQKRRVWSRSRGVLRQLLACYLSADPHALRFVRGAHGKLTLADACQAARPPLHFNLSHSGDIALYAFTADAAVGVDVQLIRTQRQRGSYDRVNLTRRVFGEQQAERLSTLDADEREREFARLWTRYEAELKRRGIGIAGGSPTHAEGLGGWIAELDIHPNGAAAVACGTAPRELQMWEWAPPSS